MNRAAEVLTHAAEVLTHERRGPDVAVFTCRTPRPLPFRAGQHVPIECPYLPWRAATYAMANAPRPDRTLEFHVRAAGSGVSAALVDRLKPGDTLRLGAPCGGAMALDAYSRRDPVFVTGGTGLAPAKALIDELTRYNRTRWIHLFRGEASEDGFYDRAPLDRLAQRHPWLTIVRATGDLAAVVAARGPWIHHDFYVSGPPAMVADTLRGLERLGVPAGRIQYDAHSMPQCTAS